MTLWIKSALFLFLAYLQVAQVRADPECGPGTPSNKTCPLGACCSGYGFCGLTDAFCSTQGPSPCVSNCVSPPLPSCGASRTLRKVGYYAGWGNRSTTCPEFNVAPNQMDFTGYTHVHFAFASISQDSSIQVASEDDPLLRQLVERKSQYPGLKVLIAVGGAGIAESDSFSSMTASPTSRATFINSVKAFLNTYKLDGIDIDFEYPGDADRNAPAQDTSNLTAFFSELRSALPSSAIISIATPGGYWFLKGFEIDKIAGSVTYMNMMSYDYHGPWDAQSPAPVTNPHTSIKDMRDSVLLYRRAGIAMEKVNLGLAWYGRTYHLTDSSCSGYNCKMDGGGTAGRCTKTPGYLAQFEISTDILTNGVVNHLDSDSQTHWVDKGSDLITFDQTDTWNAKTNFASQTCFGGTFIWSLDMMLRMTRSSPPPTIAGSPQTVTSTVTPSTRTDTSTLNQGGIATTVHPSPTLTPTSIGAVTSGGGA